MSIPSVSCDAHAKYSYSMILRMNLWRLPLILNSSTLIVRGFQYLLLLNPLTSCLTVHKDDISREQLKELLYEEIMSFQPAPIT